jgi:hypothetical protein
MAQHSIINTPPEVSPMLMKPEMTEIWEPENSYDRKTNKRTTSDAIILFDDKNMD